MSKFRDLTETGLAEYMKTVDYPQCNCGAPTPERFQVWEGINGAVHHSYWYECSKCGRQGSFRRRSGISDPLYGQQVPNRHR